MEKGKKGQDKKEGKKKENKEEKEKKEKKKKTKAVLKCKSGHPLTQRPPEDSGWFCSASKDSGGCRRALAEKAVASGGISSSRFPFADSRSEMSTYIFRYPSYSCLPCAYRICDLCYQTKSADVADQKKKPEKKKDKKENAPKKVKKDTLPTPALAMVKPLELRGAPGMVPAQRDALVKSVLQKVQLGALEEASLLVCKSSHLSTVGEVMESLVVCLMETDTKTRTAGGQLLDTLLIRGAFEPDLVKNCVLEKLVEMSVDMIEVVPNFWESLAEIFSPSFNSATLPLSAIKDSANLLPSDKMVSHFSLTQSLTFKPQVGDFLSAVLNKMAVGGKMKTHKAWRDSGLKWTDMVTLFALLNFYNQTNLIFESKNDLFEPFIFLKDICFR